MAPDAEVSVHVAAPPERVYELVADLPSMGRWSPECERCEWIGGATKAAPGAKFKGHNRIGRRSWSTTGTVAVADPGRELAWDVASVMNLPVARWRYVIDAEAGGCRVTESTEDRRGRVMHVLGRLATGVGNRPEHNRAGMERTLQKIKAAAEADR
ncbi:MAG: SRPBCC family protein [Actinobacteria bacterium]|nr:SRPBCC family protein [Actinomycetota bacterium]